MERVTLSAHTYPAAADKTSVAQVERAQLCDLFDQVGPDAPTLCAGWDAHHLAAHLVARESSPLALVNLVRPKAAEAELERLVSERELGSLVEELRSGPPKLSVFGTGFTDKHGNGLEFYIHHEDVRRAGSEPGARDVPQWAEDEIWSGLTIAVRGLMRKAPVGAALRRSDTGELRVAASKAHAVIVTGPPSELALFAFGRGSAADVTFDGAPDDVDRLRTARFGF